MAMIPLGFVWEALALLRAQCGTECWGQGVAVLYGIMAMLLGFAVWLARSCDPGAASRLYVVLVAGLMAAFLGAVGIGGHHAYLLPGAGGLVVSTLSTLAVPLHRSLGLAMIVNLAATGLLLLAAAGYVAS